MNAEGAPKGAPCICRSFPDPALERRNRLGQLTCDLK